MSGVVCAVRGGVASQPTILQAIRTAREHGLPIYFLYVVNADFLMHTARSRVHTIMEELRALGEFILLSAQDQAAASGVTAYGKLRDGSVASEIIALCREVDAGFVVLGRPQRLPGGNVFTEERLTQLGDRIGQETGARVIVAAPGAA